MVSVTLQQIRTRAAGNAYPVELLEDCGSALLLFAAGFHGSQDAIFVADAGIQATCVDIDSGRLHEMAEAYPAAWEFVVADAFAFAHNPAGYDLVSVDCPTNLFDRCAAAVGVWCSLARKAVVLGTGQRTTVVAPDGWEIAGVICRSDMASWTVLEPTG